MYFSDIRKTYLHNLSVQFTWTQYPIESLVFFHNMCENYFLSFNLFGWGLLKKILEAFCRKSWYLLLPGQTYLQKLSFERPLRCLIEITIPHQTRLSVTVYGKTYFQHLLPISIKENFFSAFNLLVYLNIFVNKGWGVDSTLWSRTHHSL